MKSGSYKLMALTALLMSGVLIAVNATAEKPDKPPPPVFTVYSGGLIDPAIDSYSMGRDWQIVFRDAYMELSEFVGRNSLGDYCNHGFRPGIIVLKPKSRKNPLIAKLEFWFHSELESGESAPHLFIMEGVFDEPGNWPPTEADPHTTLTFNYWEVAAENKWAQRQDCAGGTTEEEYPDGPWTVSVTRVQ
jgi:hypothetical protein